MRTVNLVVIGLAGIICVALPTALLQGQMLQAGEAQVYVAALRKDRPVMGLGPDDFRIEEDGDRREVIRVEPAIVGFDLAVLVDDSMVGNNVVHFRQALRSFFQSMKGHRISLQTFGDERRTVVDYTTDLEPLLLAADEFTGFSETSAYLLRAIDETARELAVRRAARPMMVVVTTEGRGAPDLAIRGSVLGQGGRSTPEATRDQDANAVVDRLWAYGIGMHAVARTTPRTVAGFSESSRSSGLATLTSGAGAFRWMQENRERERV
ncbi:MAG TPA: VWA domain-containing protein, partial [Acidobacteria bacterium]|nr:VWA domain-containing protein [Acidobacteriota bacterium]